MQNGGEFNDVGHYHLHIFPRYKDDGFSWMYGGEKKKDTVDIVVEIRKRL